MKIEDGIKLDFDDVLIKPKRSTLRTRSGVDIERSYSYLHSDIGHCAVPIIAANMDTVGTMAMSSQLTKNHMMTCLHKHYTIDELVGFFGVKPRTNTFFTIGIKEDDIEKLMTVSERLSHTDNTTNIPFGCKIYNICIDVANGYQKVFVDHVKRIRRYYPEVVIMAGNVCTPEMVSELLISGYADIIKIGIGPGSVCTTRKITGCGYPQLSAIIECADAAHGLGGHICADGGCKEPGDVVKAFAAGADFVMLGGMFAGTEECEGEWEYEYNRELIDQLETLDVKSVMEESYEADLIEKTKIKKCLKFYGMSSSEAMQKYSGGVGLYRTSEGKVESVPYRGPVKNTLQEITGGIRSACAYVGASTLKDLPKCTTFIRVNRIH